jgi:DNA helicase II / ATP-dependent DNA helicase PcrA
MSLPRTSLRNKSSRLDSSTKLRANHQLAPGKPLKRPSETRASVRPNSDHCWICKPMDAFETIRSGAAALHAELVSEGKDPFDPLGLVQAAAARRGLEIVWLPRGDPGLKGAQALYDEQGGMICCEAEGDPAARALLVAHELGHSDLHGGSVTCVGSDVDPSRSTEAAPVGLQRVEDYGARERRELQANVYARELVLPRASARDWYLHKDLTAAAISERTTLPVALVRQQLFDALLLPPMTVESLQAPEQPLPLKPDASQDRAAAHRSKPFQLQAGPGTGKTRALVKRVLSLLAEGVDPSAILILTFSNRAAGELAERLIAAAPVAAPKLWIGTFHAFGLDLVRRYHDKLGLSPNPSLFDRSDAIAVLEDILPTLPLVHYRNLWDPAMVLRDIVAAISRAKDEMVDPQRYRSLAKAMQTTALDEEERIAAAKCLEIADIYDLYEAALRQHGGVDFGDLIMRPARLLEAPRERTPPRDVGRRWRAALGRRRCEAVDLSVSRRLLQQHVAVRCRLSWRCRRSARNQLSIDGANRRQLRRGRATHGRITGHADTCVGGRSRRGAEYSGDPTLRDAG